MPNFKDPDVLNGLLFTFGVFCVGVALIIWSAANSVAVVYQAIYPPAVVSTQK